MYKRQDLLSAQKRTTFTAEEGNELAVSDFSAIEARVIAWYANVQAEDGIRDAA
ncbi:hypothetical protein JMUB7520_27480 [Staphylococcus aureus]